MAPSSTDHQRPPSSFELLQTLDDTDSICSFAFDPRSHTLVTSSTDGPLKIWDLATGRPLRVLGNHREVFSLAFHPDGQLLACGSQQHHAQVIDVATGETEKILQGPIWQVAYSVDGRLLSTWGGSNVRVWSVPGYQLIRSLDHARWARGVAFHAAAEIVATCGDKAVRSWNVATGKCLHESRFTDDSRNDTLAVCFHPHRQFFASSAPGNAIDVRDPMTGELVCALEGHTDVVDALAFSPDGAFLASRSLDSTIRVWNCETWETSAILDAPIAADVSQHSLAFHPTLPLLASVVSRGANPSARAIRLWQFDADVLLGQRSDTAIHYVNAKVVLVGDTGVGKSGLSLVLNGQPFEATDSTPGRHVWTFDSEETSIGPNRRQTRETLLWDLAGQPGYRIIHQLHLNEVAVALVVFDARSETDPLSGVRHWERALRLAHTRGGSRSVPMKKFLVSARTDRGAVSVSKARIKAFCVEFGFDGYFETSAKEGWQIDDLRTAVKSAIPWPYLPVVSSERLFAEIKAFLLRIKESGRLLAAVSQLHDEFGRDNATRAEFETCIGRLENRDLIRRLSFGGYVLLQPELLDAYASAIVNHAKNEPDGFGSISEDDALGGRFFVPNEQKIADRGQEQLLLHATVEELVKHDLALRENADNGRYLVFPSQFNRDYSAAPEPEGTAVVISFDGPVQSIYSTLAVRLSHSGLFATDRTKMWRNAAVFSATAGGGCGIFVREFADEGHGQVLLFFDSEASEQTRFHFEDYVHSHLRRRAIDGSIDLTRYFICVECASPVPERYVKILREKGKREFECPCGSKVAIVEPEERLGAKYPSQVAVMDRSADRQRDFDALIVSASGETHTESFVGWAGDARAMLAIVFTDVVGSTALENRIGSERMNVVRRSHFAQARKLLAQYRGREIKTIGDSFMVAFRRVEEALDFSLALQEAPGDRQIQVRAGIHVGAMQIEEDDVFGGTVNFAARVVGAAKGANVWLSDRAHEDIHALRAERHQGLKWKRHAGEAMKGFRGTFTLWSLRA
ncbi:MAG TPA: adenylate/guanylate cyclase domain-containing protein [Gemmatimonadaceae bacterium]|nr:MAG: hypothetical protein DMF56_06780 [Acidobacteriota bacterium]HTD82928.1 adenylate/guanylate cyclase domain-containing protein [Gemmatimonadaceae bacterium]